MLDLLHIMQHSRFWPVMEIEPSDAAHVCSMNLDTRLILAVGAQHKAADYIQAARIRCLCNAGLSLAPGMCWC